jgi:hypothetical protein
MKNRQFIQLCGFIIFLSQRESQKASSGWEEREKGGKKRKKKKEEKKGNTKEEKSLRAPAVIIERAKTGMKERRESEREAKRESPRVFSLIQGITHGSTVLI